MALKFCPYCGYEKDMSRTSPTNMCSHKRSGGNLNPTNPFSDSRVPDRATPRDGRWIDGRFIRSWPISIMRAPRHTHDSSGRGDRSCTLRFMGRLEDYWPSPDGTVCDFWIGPTGDHVYHFHQGVPRFRGVCWQTTTHTSRGLRSQSSVSEVHVASNPAWPPLVYASVAGEFPAYRHRFTC